MSNQTKQPIRIRLYSRRYEVSASLFDVMLKSAIKDHMQIPDDDDIYPATPGEEFMMGIMEDEDSESGMFVKPLSADALKAILAERSEDGVENEGIDTMEMITEGYLLCEPAGEGENISIVYDETELTGMEGASSTIAYNTSEPDLVHLVRSGSVTTAMTFKPHHRAICVYQTPYMPFQVAIHCLSVSNLLEGEGMLKLDYIIEIKGAQAERCQMTMQILD